MQLYSKLSKDKQKQIMDKLDKAPSGHSTTVKRTDVITGYRCAACLKSWKNCRCKK